MADESRSLGNPIFDSNGPKEFAEQLKGVSTGFNTMVSALKGVNTQLKSIESRLDAILTKGKQAQKLLGNAGLTPSSGVGSGASIPNGGISPGQADAIAASGASGANPYGSWGVPGTQTFASMSGYGTSADNGNGVVATFGGANGGGVAGPTTATGGTFGGGNGMSAAEVASAAVSGGPVTGGQLALAGGAAAVGALSSVGASAAQTGMTKSQAVYAIQNMGSLSRTQAEQYAKTIRGWGGNYTDLATGLQTLNGVAGMNFGSAAFNRNARLAGAFTQIGTSIGSGVTFGQSAEIQQYLSSAAGRQALTRVGLNNLAPNQTNVFSVAELLSQRLGRQMGDRANGGLLTNQQINRLGGNGMALGNYLQSASGLGLSQGETQTVEAYLRNLNKPGVNTQLGTASSAAQINQRLTNMGVNAQPSVEEQNAQQYRSEAMTPAQIAAAQTKAAVDLKTSAALLKTASSGFGQIVSKILGDIAGVAGSGTAQGILGGAAHGLEGYAALKYLRGGRLFGKGGGGGSGAAGDAATGEAGGEAGGAGALDITGGAGLGAASIMAAPVVAGYLGSLRAESINRQMASKGIATLNQRDFGGGMSFGTNVPIHDLNNGGGVGGVVKDLYSSTIGSFGRFTGLWGGNGHSQKATQTAAGSAATSNSILQAYEAYRNAPRSIGPVAPVDPSMVGGGGIAGWMNQGQGLSGNAGASPTQTTNTTSTSGKSTQPNSKNAATGNQVVQTAAGEIGLPYVWGGGTASGPSGSATAPPNQVGKAGFDCSGLTLYAMARHGIQLPHFAASQAKMGTEVKSLSEAMPGDLVFYAGSDGTPSAPGHVGIYAGNGKMIDAPYTGVDVRYDPVGSPVAIRRFLASNGKGNATQGNGGTTNASMMSYVGNTLAGGGGSLGGLGEGTQGTESGDLAGYLTPGFYSAGPSGLGGGVGGIGGQQGNTTSNGTGTSAPSYSGGGGGGNPIFSAVKGVTHNVDVMAAMMLGSYVETTWHTNASGGGADGPWQIQLNAHPGVTAQQADNPQWAARYMVGEYTAAVNSVPRSMWQKQPEQAALDAVYKAERPGIPYNSGNISEGWKLTSQLLGVKSYQVGSQFIENEGLAYLHAGEMVIRSGAAAAMRMNQMSGGESGGTTIIIQQGALQYHAAASSGSGLSANTGSPQQDGKAFGDAFFDEVEKRASVSSMRSD